MSVTALGMIPGSSAEFPFMVCVFPEDVCPYAKTVPLNPEATACMICFVRAS